MGAGWNMLWSRQWCGCWRWVFGEGQGVNGGDEGDGGRVVVWEQITGVRGDHGVGQCGCLEEGQGFLDHTGVI